MMLSSRKTHETNGSLDHVSVVMISMNEEDSVAKVIDDIKRDAPGVEIILVDSSTDQTPVIAEQHGAQVIRQYPPQGYGSAMLTALRAGQGSVVVTLDCDNTYPTEMIPKLVSLVQSGYKVAGTTRISQGKPEHMPFPNYLANKFFNVFASLLFFHKIRDVHTGMRAYDRELLNSIEWDAQGAALPVELLLKPARLGYRLIELPISYGERIGETTLSRFDSTKWTLKRILRSRFSSVKTR